MKFSLVLATLGRVSEVERLFKSLERQTYKDFEVILVDQNPDNRLQDLAKEFEGRLSIRHFRIESRGLSRARNFGLARSSGEIVTFPDDDCEYPEDLLCKVFNILFDRHEIDVLTGRSVDHSGRSSNGRFHLVAGRVDKMNLWFRSIEYTLFARIKALDGHSFDEFIGVGAGTPLGAGEGADLVMSLLESGAGVYYDPDVVAIHGSPYLTYDARDRKKAASYGYGLGYVIKRHKMPWLFRLKWLVRAVVASILALLRLDLPEARYRWSIFSGRLKGLLG